MTNLEVGDIVMCTVDRIVGTIVFVNIDELNKEGGIILSEIAPGRIRNLREYVVPKKKIVCKILRILGNRIDLSLRRVTKKDQKEIREQYKQEKSYKSILKTVLKEKAEGVIKEILQKEKIYEFLQEAKENPKKLEKLVGKTETEKILDILKTQKQKEVVIKKEISLTTTKPNGIVLIKKILGGTNEAEIKYISAGKYSIKTKSTDPKTADKKLKIITADIEKKAKEQGMKFDIIEK